MAAWPMAQVRLTRHAGQIDAWIIAKLGWTTTVGLHTAIAWVVVFVRESLLENKGTDVCFLTGSYDRSEHTRWNLYSFTGPYQPVVQVRLHSTGAASRLAALLGAQI
jgi:hypothetical protein